MAEITAVGLFVGLAAGCSQDVTRFNAPLFTGSTDNQKRIIKDGEHRTSYDDIVTGSVSSGGDAVESTPLKDRTPARATGKRMAAERRPAARGDTVRVARADVPDRRGRARDSRGRWSKVGGTTIVLKANEDLQTISRRYGVPLSALLRANNVRSGRVFGPGDKVIVPTYAVGGRRDASRTASLAPDKGKGHARRASASASTHKVKSGDTLYSIARTYGVSRSELIRANGIDNADKIRIGMTLKIPGKAVVVASASRSTPKTSRVTEHAAKASKPRHAARKAKTVTRVASRSSETGTTSAAGKVDSTETGSTRKAATETAPTTTASISAVHTPTPSASRTLFRWPVRGRIIAQFGRLPNGQNNDGINLAVPEGTSVKAADNGTVIYAGNELKGYGNLLLISHADGWVSAYAHNSELMVSRGDVVRRGQIIARAGATGNVDRPQLHFELRRNSKPVNPTPFMSGA